LEKINKRTNSKSGISIAPLQRVSPEVAHINSPFLLSFLFLKKKVKHEQDFTVSSPLWLSFALCICTERWQFWRWFVLFLSLFLFFLSFFYLIITKIIGGPGLVGDVVFVKSFEDGSLTGWYGGGLSISSFVTGGYQGTLYTMLAIQNINKHMH